MTKLSIVLSSLLVISLGNSSQANSSLNHLKARQYLDERGEVYFRFYVNSLTDIHDISEETMISIDKIEGNTVYAYANKEKFSRFNKHNLLYETLLPPCYETTVEMSDTYDDPERGTRFDFYRYPTFGAYVQQMNAWAAQYPNICKLITLGRTGNNRDLLGIRISNNINATNGKPKYLNSSTVHGDEVLTYMTTLHLIDTLLSSYGRDQRLTKIVDSIDIYLCPLLNPDATYLRGDNTVQNARRFSVTDNFDLNRNYPCFCGNTTHALYGLYNKTALETQAMLSLQRRYTFAIMSDDHGGIEAIYHGYGCVGRNLPDRDWIRWVCRRFADQVHRDCNNNGYFMSATRGVGHWYSQMYVSHGTRIDYQAFYRHGKGFGPETSTRKVLDENLLRSRWIYLKNAYFDYIELLYTGIQGIVTDSITKQPIFNAKMERNGDFDNAHVFTDSAGFYIRFTDKGTYTLTFSHPNYRTKAITGFRVEDWERKYPLNVELCPINVAVSTTPETKIQVITCIPYQKGIRFSFNGNTTALLKADIYSINGIKVRTVPFKSNNAVWDGRDEAGNTAANGCYIVKIAGGNQRYVTNFIVKN